MNVSTIRYETSKATEFDIYWHLMKCDNNFTPPLSTRVRIEDYANKIFDNAVTFEAWSLNVLVGLVAAYFNDANNSVGYITSVSVIKDYERQGIALDLMSRCIDYAREHKFGEIALEVHRSNRSAIQLYGKCKFVYVDNKNDMMLMKVSGLMFKSTE